MVDRNIEVSRRIFTLSWRVFMLMILWINPQKTGRSLWNIT